MQKGNGEWEGGIGNCEYLEGNMSTIMDELCG